MGPKLPTGRGRRTAYPQSWMTGSATTRSKSEPRDAALIVAAGLLAGGSSLVLPGSGSV